jgi:hypothetical protein
MSIPTKLEIEIDDTFEALAGMEKGSEPYKGAVDGVGKLLDRAIEVERLEDEREERKHARKKEQIDFYVDTSLKVLKIAAEVGVVVWGTILCLNFEKTGTVTSRIGGGYLNALRPKSWGKN